MERNRTNKGAWISLAIGGPLGLLLMVLIVAGFSYFLLMLGDMGGFMAIMFIHFVRFPLIVSAAFFLIALWVGGRIAEKMLSGSSHLLKAAFLHSIMFNTAFWLSFSLCIGIGSGFEAFSMLLMVNGTVCATGIVLSGFTFSLFVSWIIKRRINKKTELSDPLKNSQNSLLAY